LLPFAIESVLEQSVTDFELLIICDGAPPETVACAKAYAERDARVHVFEFPKGARHGEEHRDRVLNEAMGRYVAQICDDDLWFPNHLEEMERLLTTADFGNLLHVHVRPQGTIEIFPGDLGRPEVRQRMKDERYNFFGLSFAGYRLETYKQLPRGWSPAPPDIWTDLFMWRKFLAKQDLVFGTRAAITALHFAAPERDSWTVDDRRDENCRFLERIRDPRTRKGIEEEAWRSLIARTIELDGVATSRDELKGQLKSVRSELKLLRMSQRGLKIRLKQTKETLRSMLRSTSWRLTAPLRKLGNLLRQNS
jgi:glycosyltransferase involved in cell wall biosynthesis